MSILAGIDESVDDWLDVEPKGAPPHYRHRAAANALSRRDTTITGTLAFLEASYARIHENWLAAVDAGYSEPSKENWRFKRHPKLGENNRSPELKLERAIVVACGEDWSNQMPTASGLTGPATDKRSAVDLVLREGPTSYSFIELKVNSDTPLFAAIEILKYGMLFIWSKNNQKILGYDPEQQPILAADTVTLTTLAPAEYYSNFDLTNVASALNGAIFEFGKQHGLSLRFEFCQLGKDYEPDVDTETVRSSINARSTVWVSKCPSCASGNIAAIVYGYPGPEMFEDKERGDIVLGGCCVTEDDPAWHCRDCEHKW